MKSSANPSFSELNPGTLPSKMKEPSVTVPEPKAESDFSPEHLQPGPGRVRPPGIWDRTRPDLAFGQVTQKQPLPPGHMSPPPVDPSALACRLRRPNGSQSSRSSAGPDQVLSSSAGSAHFSRMMFTFPGLENQSCVRRPRWTEGV